jgi:hypothetical protein
MQHLIKKQEFLLRIAPGLEPFGVQHAASGFYRDTLLSALERVFDELSTEDEVILIDRLVIDIGSIAENCLHGFSAGDELYVLIKKELQRVLKGERPEVGLLRAELRENALSQWWYYMEKGRLPWNVTVLNKDWYQQVLEMLSVDYASVTRLRQELEGQAAFLQRVSHQHPDEFLETLTGILTGMRQPLLAQRVEAICVLSQWLENTFYDMTALIGGQNGSAEKRATIIRALRRWMEARRPFLTMSAPERKAAVWRMLLREAAMRPARVRAQGAEGILLREFLYPRDRVIHQLLRESGLALPKEWFDRRDTGTSRLEARKQDQRENGTTDHGILKRESDDATRSGEAARGEDAEKNEDATRSEHLLRHEEPLRRPEEANEGHAEVLFRKTSEEAEGSGGESPDIERTAKPVEKARVTQRDESLEKGGLFGRHAGLILLHPFLPTFFQRCGLWINGTFTHPQARQQAVFLLYFLATGEKEGPEYELLFPKLLCGYGLEDAMPARIGIPEACWAEGQELLQNALLQWDKLKNTSVDGLREGFLQRTGKLLRQNDRLQLMMEMSAIDVLLDYLPWGIGLVKLPWYKEIIYVEWR